MQTNAYFTPIKTVHTFHPHLHNSDSTHRQGDWICFNCQNHNYSFRKKCNRCKTQSRQENDKYSVYSYYYYSRNDALVGSFDHKDFDQFVAEKRGNFEGENSKLNKDDDKENQPCEFNAVMETPKKKKTLMSTHNHSKLDGLPSVSPLVKKYRQKQHHTTSEKLKDSTNIFESSHESKDFHQSIKIRDFDQLVQDLGYGGKTDFDASPFQETLEEEDLQDLQGINFMKDIEESIARIII